MGTDITVVRIYLHETEHGRRKSLMEEILNILQKQHEVRGVSVFRAIVGLDESGETHASDFLRLMVNLPIVIEFFDVPERVEAVLAALEGAVPPGQIVRWSGICR